MNKILSFFIVLLACVSAAKADLMTINGGNTGALPSDYDHMGGTVSAGDNVVFWASIAANKGVKIVYEFIGKEAAWDNKLVVDHSFEFNNITSVSGDAIVSYVHAGQLLDFQFFTPYDSISNGDSNTSGPQFFIKRIVDNVFYIGLNDDGCVIDGDYDDMIIKITVEDLAVKIPLPGTAFLIGIGLIGLRLIRVV